MISQTLNNVYTLFRMMGCAIFGLIMVGGFAFSASNRPGAVPGESFFSARGSSSATVGMQPEQVMATLLADSRLDGEPMEITSSTPDGVVYAPIPLGKGGGDLPGSVLSISTVRDQEVRFTLRTGSGAQGHVAITITPDGSGSKLAVGDPIMESTGPEADRDRLEDRMDAVVVRVARLLVRQVEKIDEQAQKASGAA